MKQNRYAILGMVLAGSVVVSVGCSKPGGEDASAAQKLGGSFTTEMTLNMDDLQASGTLSRTGEGAWSVSFAEPSTLAGVVLEFCDSEVSASYKGLAFSVPQTAMPAKSVLSNLIQVVDTLAQQEEITGEASDGYVIVEGELEGNPYTLKLTESGELAGFEMDNLDAVLEFEQFQSGAPVATATTAAAGTEMESVE